MSQTFSSLSAVSILPGFHHGVLPALHGIASQLQALQLEDVYLSSPTRPAIAPAQRVFGFFLLHLLKLSSSASLWCFSTLMHALSLWTGVTALPTSLRSVWRRSRSPKSGTTARWLRSCTSCSQPHPRLLGHTRRHDYPIITFVWRLRSRFWSILS